MAYVSIEQKRKQAKKIVLWIVCGVLFIAVILLGGKILTDKGILNFKGNSGKSDKNNQLANSAAPTDSDENKSPEADPTDSVKPYAYINENGMTLGERFNPPENYTRMEQDEGSFGAYLRNYPLKAYGSDAYYYDSNRGKGEELVVSKDTSKVGVFKQQDTLTRWQQCADTAIMLYAEYLYGQGRYDEISFEFSNRFKCDYSSWAAGKRVNISGNKTEWVDKAGTDGVKADDYSYETFLKYLDIIYQYANTNSLVTQFRKISANEMKPGDIMVATYTDLKNAARQVSEELAESINYGHAIIIVDVAVNAAGEKVFMLAEGNTPATEAAVIENPDTSMGVWFKFDEMGTFVKGSSGIKWSSGWIYSFGG